MVEKDIQTDIMLAATARGHRLFRNNIGLAKYTSKKSGKKSAVKYGVGGDGAPDLMGWTKDGFFAAVEVKQPGKEPTEDQARWHAAALRNPFVRVGWADNVADAMAILETPRPPAQER